MKSKLPLISVIAFLSLALDQLTKYWARGTLRGTRGFDLIDNYLRFEYHENPGMAFGMGRDWPGGRFILIGLGLAVIFFVWYLVKDVKNRQKLTAVAFGLVAGGAIGNFIDRITIGRVVDFIVMHWRHKHAWPAYNIADAVLVVGVGLLLIALSAQPKKDDAPETASKRSQRSKKSSKRSSKKSRR
ncbi:MAG: signal peptidase II [Deltaproteobacteria bacterium]|nr:signal peptidase II [Deltaproteobacteria bacterium]